MLPYLSSCMFGVVLEWLIELLIAFSNGAITEAEIVNILITEELKGSFSRASWTNYKSRLTKYRNEALHYLTSFSSFLVCVQKPGPICPAGKVSPLKSLLLWIRTSRYMVLRVWIGK